MVPRFCLFTVPDVIAARTCGGFICFGLFFKSVLYSAVDCWRVFALDSSTRFNSVVCPFCYWWNTNNAALKNGKIHVKWPKMNISSHPRQHGKYILA